MAKDLIIIGCKLPHGLMLIHPLDKTQKVQINGLNTAKVIGSTFVTTEVDADFWATWKAAYLDYAPLKSGAIFEARTQTEASAKAKELAKEKTGFEPIPQESLGVKPEKEK